MADEEKQASAQPEAPKMTREQSAANVRNWQEMQFSQSDYSERMVVGLRKKLVKDDPCLVYSLEELRVLVPLNRDRLNYNWENKDKGTFGVLSLDRHGFFAMPKPHGRRNKHMTKKHQAIKSESLRIFRELFEQMAQTLKATRKEQEIEYLGLPASILGELGAKAARFAAIEVSEQKKMASRQVRRRQEFSRKVNAALLPSGSCSETKYVNRGGQYGR